MHSIPTIGHRVAPETTARRRTRPTLAERWRVALRLARPETRVVGERLDRIVTEASKPDAALLTQTGERALDALIATPRVPLERLYAFGWSFIAHVRAGRGMPAPDLATAMRREQTANAHLDLAQWQERPVLTRGDLYAMRELTGLQLVATHDLLAAIDDAIAQQEGAAALAA